MSESPSCKALLSVISFVMYLPSRFKDGEDLECESGEMTESEDEEQEEDWMRNKRRIGGIISPGLLSGPYESTSSS